MTKTTDRNAGVIIFLFGALVTFESWRMPRFEKIGGSLLNAPGLVPGMLGIIIAVLGAIMVMRFYAARRLARRGAVAAPPPHAVETPEEVAAEVTAGMQPASMPRLLVTLALSVLFAGVLVGRVPFWLAIFLFVAASIVYYEKDRLRSTAATARVVAIAAAIAGATAFAVPFVFERLFLVTLP